ncbi:hypothetical protein [Streptomyces sp. NPDC001744]|uniref:hypothetical protein n=1 Tax=Streptomyces sp. NPDC001744 TaxID=3364606 RepID=UPI0036CB5C4E
MHVRRTPYLLLAAFLAAGCVAVPPGPGPSSPPARPGALAPAADRAPSPLPARPAPVQAAPREELATAEPGAGPRPGATRAPASLRPPERGGALDRPRPAADRPGRPGAAKTGRPGTGKTGTRAVPRPPEKRAPARLRPRTPPPADGRRPELRRLCRQAERIRAPMGAADLCRRVYGR